MSIVKIIKFITAVISIDSGKLITRTPGLHGGCPHILGKGVTVRRIVTWYKRGLTAEEIGDRIRHLCLAEVYAALTYYHANTQELETYLLHQAAEVKRLEAWHSNFGKYEMLR